MSIPDDLIFTYYRALTDISFEELEEIKEKISKTPYELKKDLAFFVTFIIHGENVAKEAEYKFKSKFSVKQLEESDFVRLEYNLLSEEKSILTILKDL
jgi:tyrosyl-tRNA synthetase